MAQQWINCFLYRPGDPSSKPQHPHKNTNHDIAAYAGNSSIGSGKRWISWPASLAEMASFQLSERPSLRALRQRKRSSSLLWPPIQHAYTQVFVCTHLPIYTKILTVNIQAAPIILNPLHSLSILKLPFAYFHFCCQWQSKMKRKTVCPLKAHSEIQR